MFFGYPPAPGQPDQPQQPPSTTTWEDARTCAVGLKSAGASGSEILNKLSEFGLSPEEAQDLLFDLEKPSNKPQPRRVRRGRNHSAQASQLLKASEQGEQEDGRKNMLVGGGVCLLGLLGTWASFASAKNGGSFFIAFGAIIWGALQFFRGFSQSNQPLQ